VNRQKDIKQLVKILSHLNIFYIFIINMLMKNPIINIFLIFVLTEFSLAMLTGGFARVKDFHKNKDVMECYKHLETRHGELNHKDEVFAQFPIAVYQQVVNGMNYIYVTVATNKKSKTIELMHGKVYTGSFGAFFMTSPSVTSLQSTKETLSLLRDLNLSEIEKAIVRHEKSEKDLDKIDPKVVIITESIQDQLNLGYIDSFFIVKAQMSKNEGKFTTRYYVMKQDWNSAVLEVMREIEFSY